MNITTKCRYALQAVMDLAISNSAVGRRVSVVDIAKRQNIEVSYLEKILVELRNAELLCSKTGPQGGYHLAKSATEMTVREVLMAVSDNHKLTRCSRQKTPGGCLENSEVCIAHKFWKKLERHIADFMMDYTIHEVCYGKEGEENHVRSAC